MPTEDLKQRYQWISKNALSMLKDKGFRKIGDKFIKENGDFTFEIYSSVPRPWINTSDFYEFEIFWQILTINNKYLALSNYMEGVKGKKAHVLSLNIIPKHLHNCPRILSKSDPVDFDNKYVMGIKEELESTILPLFNRINTIDDLINIAEQEEKLEKGRQKYFSRTNIYRCLINLYIVKDRIDEALEICDKYVKSTPLTAQKLAENIKRKYIQYLKNNINLGER